MAKNRQSSHQVLDSVLITCGGYRSDNYSSVLFQNLAVRNYSSSTLLYQLWIPYVSQFGVFHQAAKKYRAEYHQQNSEI